jgi:NADPH2:quinone reductase
MPMVAAGRIKPLIDRVLPFSQVPQAQKAMLDSAHVGKIVVSME